MLTFCDIKLHIITANHVNKILGHLLVSRHLGKGLFKLLVDRLELLLLGHQLVLKAVHLFTVNGNYFFWIKATSSFLSQLSVVSWRSSTALLLMDQSHKVIFKSVIFTL